MRELISAVTSDSTLEAVAIGSGFDANSSRASIKLREHLAIQRTQEPDAKAVLISFVDSRPLTAQKVVANVVNRLIDNSLKSNSGIKVELYDPVHLPVDPSFPNRPIAAGAGFSMGLAWAIAMGIWRYWKGSYPWDATDRGYRLALHDELLPN
jgi:hypothetical protein